MSRWSSSPPLGLVVLLLSSVYPTATTLQPRLAPQPRGGTVSGAASRSGVTVGPPHSRGIN